MTATRFTREAILYVTGDVRARMTNARTFCRKCTVPLARKYMVTLLWMGCGCAGCEMWVGGADRNLGRSVHIQMGIIKAKAILEE